MRFTGRSALVTGGGRGIGRAVALRLAQEGADVAVADVDEQGAEAVAGEIGALDRRAVAVTADVTRPADVERMVQAVRQTFGRLDILCNNAGIAGRHGAVAEMDPAEWDRVIATNLRSTFLCCKLAVPVLVETGRGAIVNISSSMASWDTSAGGAAYMASKQGVVGLTKSLALQLAGHRIRVNAVNPGIIRTRLGFEPGMDEQEWERRYDRFARRIPLRQVGMPEDVAASVAFLASEDARHITGSMLLIDGGQTLQSWSNVPDLDAYPLYSDDA